MANKQTTASKKWQDKAGYVAKTYKLKREVIDNFQKACEYAGESQASVLTRLMNEYAEAKHIEHFEDGAEADDLKHEGGGLPRIIKQFDFIPAKYRDRMSDFYKDDDGWWCELTRGWCAGTDGIHTIHEETKSNALSELKRSRRCECTDCITGKGW